MYHKDKAGGCTKSEVLEPKASVVYIEYTNECEVFGKVGFIEDCGHGLVNEAGKGKRECA